MKRILILTGLLAATAPLPAQFVDPRKKIRDIVEEIAREMHEIDRMLLRTSSSGAGEAAERMARTAQRIDKLLEQTRSSQGKVVEGIDKLLEEIQKMARQNGGSCPFGSDADSGGQPRQDRPQPGRRQQTPQPRMQRDRGSQSRSEGEEPRGGRDQRDRGRNRPASSRPEDPTQRVPPNRDAKRWGNLPRYLEFLKTRGGSPEIPERYRKFYEAFLKRSRKSEAFEKKGK